MQNISFITTVVHDFRCSVVLCACLTASVDNWRCFSCMCNLLIAMRQHFWSHLFKTDLLERERGRERIGGWGELYYKSVCYPCSAWCNELSFVVNTVSLMCSWRLWLSNWSWHFLVVMLEFLSARWYMHFSSSFFSFSFSYEYGRSPSVGTYIYMYTPVSS